MKLSYIMQALDVFGRCETGFFLEFSIKTGTRSEACLTANAFDTKLIKFGSAEDGFGVVNPELVFENGK